MNKDDYRLDKIEPEKPENTVSVEPVTAKPKTLFQRIVPQKTPYVFNSKASGCLLVIALLAIAFIFWGYPRFAENGVPEVKFTTNYVDPNAVEEEKNTAEDEAEASAEGDAAETDADSADGDAEDSAETNAADGDAEDSDTN